MINNNLIIRDMTSSDVDGVFEVEKIALNITGLKVNLKKR